MQRIILSFIITLLSTQFYAQNRVSQIREQLMSRSTNSVLVVAHRGDWRNFPENSLEGIENAIKMGVDIVELDVQRTQDGVLILMHDEIVRQPERERCQRLQWITYQTYTFEMAVQFEQNTKFQLWRKHYC